MIKPGTATERLTNVSYVRADYAKDRSLKQESSLKQAGVCLNCDRKKCSGNCKIRKDSKQ